MSLIDLTKDLSNFNWTEYSKAGTGKSPQLDGTTYYERPNPKSLEGMESKFGPIDTPPPSRGPYGVVNTMDGTKTGRGFIKPGMAPFGFTKDMDSFHNKSELEIGNELVITPLSHNIAGVTSDLSYGQVSKKELNLEPQAKGAYGVKTLPISTYSSRQPIEGIPFGAVGGNNTYYGNIDLIAGRTSQFQDDNGNYTTPQNPPFGEEQRTFRISDAYPRNNFAFTIDSQFGFSFGSKYLQTHGTPWRGFELKDTLRDQIDSGGGGGRNVTPDFYPPTPAQPQDTQHPSPSIFISSEPNYNAPSYLELKFLKAFGDTEGIWPYGVLSYDNAPSTGPYGQFNDHPLITKDIGDRYSQGGPIERWMVLQAKRTEDDVERLTKWFGTPKGQLWVGKQNFLQLLNPREETRVFSSDGILASIPPFLHLNRHIGGDTYMSVADFGPIYDGDAEPSSAGFGIGSLGDRFMSSRLAGPFLDAKSGLDSIIAGAEDLNNALGNVDFNAQGKGGRLRFLMNKMVAGSEKGSVFSLGSIGSINLTDLRNNQADRAFGKPPKIPTQYVYSQRGPFGEQGIANNQNTTPIKKYKSILHGDIGKKMRAPGLSPTSNQSSQELLDGSGIELQSEGILSEFDEFTGETFKHLSYAQVKNNQLYFKEQIDQETQKLLVEESHRKNKIAVNKLGGVGDPGRLSNAFTKKPDIDSGLGEIKVDLPNGDGYKSMAVDRVNSTPYGQNLPEGVSDYIKFKFKDLVNNKPIIFRAILSGISDSITPEWNGTRYIGRPDQVYTYTGVERKISFNFSVYPKTKQEFPILLEKLNYLVGLCYPSYAENNRMIAPFMQLTMGDMFIEAPGFLDSLSISVDDTTTWETDEGLQFPKFISCECSYTYIGKHQPSMLGLHYGINWLEDKGYGKGDDGTVNAGTFHNVKDNKEVRETPGPTRIGKEKLFEDFNGGDKSLDAPTDPFHMIIGTPAQSEGSA